MTLKVAVVSGFPTSPETTMGGAKAAVTNLVLGLNEVGGIKLVVLDPNPEQAEKRIETYNFGEVWRLPVGGAVGRVRRSRTLISQSLEMLRPDLVHVQGNARLVPQGVPAVLTIHGLIEDEIGYEEPRIRGVIKRLAIARPEIYARNRVRNICSISEHAVAGLRVDPRRRIWRIPNAVRPGLRDKKVDRSGQRVIFAGFISPRKNVLMLIRAFAQASRSLPQLRLAIAGGPLEGPYADECRHLVETLGLSDRVDFLGVLNSDEMAAEMAQSSCLALPANAEVAPMVISEALSLGVPVVATAVGGVPQMIRDGVDGVVVGVGDVDAMAAAIIRVVNDRDHDMWRDAAFRAGLAYQPTAVAQRTFEMYEEIVRS